MIQTVIKQGVPSRDCSADMIITIQADIRRDILSLVYLVDTHIMIQAVTRQVIPNMDSLADMIILIQKVIRPDILIRAFSADTRTAMTDAT